MSQLKAFQIEIEMVGETETGIIADADASKARYLIYLHLREFGYKNAATGKPWPALTDLRVVRAPAFDQWAQAQPGRCHRAQPYAEQERAKLPAAA